MYFTIKIGLAISFLVFCQSCSQKRELKLHDSQGVLRHEWFYEKDTLTGRRITYFPSGQVKEIHNFENGKLNGEYLGYYANGHIARRSYWYNNIVRGPALKFFEHADSLVEMETYYLDVKGKQYMYYRKVFDKAGGLISEERTVRLEFNCGQGRKLARIIFADDFPYDSVYVIAGKFAADFSPDKTATIDTVRASQLPVSMLLDSSIGSDNVLRGKCIFFVGTNEGDSTLVNVKMRWFEERVPASCD